MDCAVQIDSFNSDIIPIDYIPHGTDRPEWYIRGKEGSEECDGKVYSRFEFVGKDSLFEWFKRYAKEVIGDIRFDCEQGRA